MAFVHRGGWQPPIGSNILKAIGAGAGRFGAYGVRFSGPDQKDLQGEYFSAAADFGPSNGDGVPVLINHGRPIEDGLEPFANIVLPAATGSRPMCARCNQVRIPAFSYRSLFSKRRRPFEIAKDR
jgi:hypothetical protein